MKNRFLLLIVSFALAFVPLANLSAQENEGPAVSGESSVEEFLPVSGATSAESPQPLSEAPSADQSLSANTDTSLSGTPSVTATPAFANESPASASPFALSLGLDIGIGATAIASWGTSIALKHFLTFPAWSDFTYDRSSIPAIDSWAVNPYSKKLDLCGTLTCGAELAAPVAVFGSLALAKEMEWGDALTVGVMYAEAVVLAQGIKELLKVGIRRLRPYTYFDISSWEVNPDYDNDFMFSTPSGHTTHAFLGAGFLTYVFCSYYPDSPWKYLVAGASYSVATATAALRIMSGNHFFTDVLAGAALGSLVGYGVPFVHHLIAESSKGSAKNETVQVTPLPLGMNIRIVL